MKSGIWETLQEEPTVLCGDGRNDSPGHNAKYCVYVLMEQFLEVIVDIEVVDKRETAGISTNMEVFGLKRLLERIVGNIIVSEVVTDASPAVIALVRKMKDKYPDDFSGLFHSLDIWHKSVKVTKKLTKAAKAKHCEAINQWIEPIRNHFWHIARNCNGDVEAFKDDGWFGVIHHVAGEHEWADGECDHGPLVSTETDKTYLDMNSKALEAIRNVVIDPRFVSSLHHVHFRHTSKLENFNSMLLKYAPKRVGFQNEAFMARTLLAAIDHNSHIFRKPALTRNEKNKYSKIYSKRSKNWKVSYVMEEKTYDYWHSLACRMLQKRVKDGGSIHRKVEIPAEHPIRISQSIALKPIPRTDDLVKQSLSRFGNAK